MTIRFSTRLTREGWHYLFVTCFVLGGAILREVNLLVVLAGMMMGPLLFGWRLAKISLRRLAVRRRLPEFVAAGETFTVEISIENQRRHLRSWGILFEDTIFPEGAGTGKAARNVTSAATVLLPQVPPGDTAVSTYRLRLPHRGRYVFGPARISTSFPLGLVRSRARLSERAGLVVFPTLGHLSREWQRVAQGQQVGSQMTHHRGLTEGDYYGLRDWRIGDSRRWIHWRTSAKRDTLSVLQFEQPRNRELVLFLDLWHPERPSDRQTGMVELAVSFAATAVVDTHRKSGAVYFAAAGAECRDWISPASPRVCQEILAHLAMAQASSDPRVSLKHVQWQRLLQGNQRVIVLSTRPYATEFCGGLGLHANRLLWIPVGEDHGYFSLAASPPAAKFEERRP